MAIKSFPLAARLAASVCALILGVSMLSACTSSSGSVGDAPTGERLAGSFDELLQQYLEEETNPFVVKVLSEAIKIGHIAQAQYDEAHRMYAECMVNAGYEEEYTRLASGVIQITPPELKDGDAVDVYLETGTECSDELAPIEALYRAQQGNPDLLADNDEVVVSCLKRSKLVDSSYTTSDFLADLEGLFKNAPFDSNDAAAQECFSAGGYSIKIEEQ